eukprot:PhM_4_TR818/c0_g2_i1/m.62942
MNNLLSGIIFVCALVLSCTETFATTPQELAALHKLYTSTGGTSWKNSSGWDTNVDPCSGTQWFGITCAAVPGTTTLSVVAIELNGNNLVGTLPPDVFQDLAGVVTQWNLGANAGLTGAVPTSFSPRLQLLNFANTKLSGTIPNLFSAYPLIQSLQLSHVQLGGTISDGISAYTALKIFQIDDTGLSGTIPDAFSKVPVQDVFLQQNDFSGTLPGTLFKQGLRQLFISGNTITGTIPASAIGDCALTLMELVVSRNQLTGTIPDTVCALDALVHADFGSNQLTSIPNCVGNMSKLSILDVSSNAIEGTIPANLCKATELTILQLQLNPSLSGTVPDCIGDLRKLSTLTIENTAVGGTIPASLFQASSVLQFVSLSNSNFFGTIPDTLDLPSRLQNVVLNGNPLNGDAQYNGSFPTSFARSKTIEVLSLQYNLITGTLPAIPPKSLPMFTQLLINSCPNLRMESFPESIVSHWGTPCSAAANPTTCSRVINFQNDAGLSGTLPEDIGSMQNVSSVTMSGTGVTGYIPLSLNTSLPWLNDNRAGFLAGCPLLLYPVPDWALVLTNGYGGRQVQLDAATSPAAIRNDTTTAISVNITGAGFVNFTSLFCGICDEQTMNCSLPETFHRFPLVYDSDSGGHCVFANLVAFPIGKLQLHVIFYGRAYGVDNQTWIISTQPADLYSYSAHPTVLDLRPINVVRQQGCATLTVIGGPFVSIPTAPSPSQASVSSSLLASTSTSSSTKFELVCAIRGVVQGTARYINRTAVVCSIPYDPTGYKSITSFRQPYEVVVSQTSFATNSTPVPPKRHSHNSSVYFEATCGGLVPCHGAFTDRYGGCFEQGSLCPCHSDGTCFYNTTNRTLQCACNVGFTTDVCAACTAQRFGSQCDVCPKCRHGHCDEGLSGSGKCKCPGYMGPTCAVSAVAVFVPLTIGLAIVSACAVYFWRLRARRRIAEEGYASIQNSDEDNDDNDQHNVIQE